MNQYWFIIDSMNQYWFIIDSSPRKSAFTFSTVGHYCVAWRLPRLSPFFLLKVNTYVLLRTSVNLLMNSSAFSFHVKVEKTFRKKCKEGNQLLVFLRGCLDAVTRLCHADRCWVLEAQNHRRVELEGAPGHFWQTAVQLRWNIISLKIGKHEMCYWHPWLYPWLAQNTVKVKPETLNCHKRSNGEGRRLFWLWWSEVKGTMTC